MRSPQSWALSQKTVSFQLDSSKNTLLKRNPASKDYVINDLYALSGKPGMASLTTDLKKFFKENPLVVNLLDKAGTFFFLIDFARMEYIYVSDGIVNITGYTAQQWMKEGLQIAFRTVFDEDRIRLKKLHEDLFRFLYSLPLEERKNYRFTFDFRVVRKDGTIIWMMEQNSMVAFDGEGKAALGFETCSEITHIKKDNTMTLSIRKAGKSGTERVEKKFYYPLEGTQCFTNREIQVLQQLYRGLTTKQIAEHLSISELTVSKHRMNMMKKANVANGTSLVSYGVKNGLI